MARFFKTKSGMYVNVDLIGTVTINPDAHNRRCTVKFNPVNAYSIDSEHATMKDAEAELAAFLEFANVPVVELLSDCPIGDQAREPAEQ